jgi:hypothetical protein
MTHKYCCIFTCLHILRLAQEGDRWFPHLPEWQLAVPVALVIRDQAGRSEREENVCCLILYGSLSSLNVCGCEA